MGKILYGIWNKMGRRLMSIIVKYLYTKMLSKNPKTLNSEYFPSWKSMRPFLISMGIKKVDD